MKQMKIKRSANLIINRKYPTFIKLMQAQTVNLNVHLDIYFNVHIDDHINVHINGMVYECSSK